MEKGRRDAQCRARALALTMLGTLSQWRLTPVCGAASRGGTSGKVKNAGEKCEYKTNPSLARLHSLPAHHQHLLARPARLHPVQRHGPVGQGNGVDPGERGGERGGGSVQDRSSLPPKKASTPRPTALPLSLCLQHARLQQPPHRLHVGPAPVGAGGRRQPPPARANVFKDQCARAQGHRLAGQAAVRDDGAAWAGGEGGGGGRRENGGY